jgi:hypothetical protein
MLDVLPGLIIFASVFGLVGRVIGNSRGRDDGFVWGFLLGPLGLVILYLGPNRKKEKEERERRKNDERRIEERHQRQIDDMQALVETLTPKQVPNSPAIVRVRRDNEELFWVKRRDEEREHGPLKRTDILDLFAANKISLDTLVAIDRGDAPKQFRALGEEVPALKMLSRKEPLTS